MSGGTVYSASQGDSSGAMSRIVPSGVASTAHRPSGNSRRSYRYICGSGMSQL